MGNYRLAMKSTHDILIASGYELLPNGRYKKVKTNYDELSVLEKEEKMVNALMQELPPPGKTSVKKRQRKADIVSRILRCQKP